MTGWPLRDEQRASGYRSATDWGFRRWIAESKAFMKPMPWWRFYPAAIRKWFWFDRQQRQDNARLRLPSIHGG